MERHQTRSIVLSLIVLSLLDENPSDFLLSPHALDTVSHLVSVHWEHLYQDSRLLLQYF